MKLETITYKNKSGFVRYYFDRILNTSINLGNPTKQDLILDFGCGDNYLKKKLPGFNIVGYDINQELSDVKDYRKVKPTKIFAISVLEHLDEEELRKTLDDFKKMNANLTLITSLPTEHFISRIGAMFYGIRRLNKESHKLRWFEVYKILNEKGFIKLKQKNVLTLSKVAVWKLK